MTGAVCCDDQATTYKPLGVSHIYYARYDTLGCFHARISVELTPTLIKYAWIKAHCDQYGYIMVF